MSASQKSLKELVKVSRSYRKFVHDFKVSENLLLEMVDMARLTPSSKNVQPLKYLLVHRESDTELVFAQLKWAWYLKDWNGPAAEERPAAYIVMLLDKNLNDQAEFDAGIAAQTILLAAAEMGLGGCIIRTFNRYELRRYFQMPENMETVLIIALGKPAQEIVIDEIVKDQSTAYYTDEDHKHHVPKRTLKDIIWKPTIQ